MKYFPLSSLRFFFFLFCQPAEGHAQEADLVFTNGKIFTSDSQQPYVQALAIKGNKILATGSDFAIKKLVSPKTKMLDLQGKTVVPGFNDAHDHPGWDAKIGKSYSYTEMDQVGLSKAAVLDSVSRLVQEARPGEWIHGLIGTSVFFDTSMRVSLDSVAPRNPVALQVWWGHGLTVNGKALEAAGLNDNNMDPVGGWYIRNTSNQITGLQQNAQAPVWIAMYNSEPANLISGMRAYAQRQLPAGITTVQFMGTGFNETGATATLAAANLPQRIRMIAFPRSTPGGRQLRDWVNGNLAPTPLTYFTGIKYVIDGSPGEENALRTVPYPGRPDWYGRFNYPIDTMKQILKEALTSDRQLLLHMTADSSFGMVLNLIQQMGSAAAWRAKRLRIEHNCVGAISAVQMAMMKEYGIIMMHTPLYCMASPLRSLLKGGVIMGISPDGTINPFFEIMKMTSTHDNPAENFSVEEAVIAYTKTNAYSEFKEREKGTLSKGMVADLVVLSQDIFTIPRQQLPSTKSLLTMIDGKIVYQQQ